jgi:hypothetical protein
MTSEAHRAARHSPIGVALVLVSSVGFSTR